MNFTAATILCCMCGVGIEANPANMCSACLQTRVDITEGIPKQLTIFWCRNCGRYQRPPFVHAELESKEMLALCLKKIKGLNKQVKLIDAAFIWTEPHSRRIKVKLTVQKEIFNGVIMQQTFVVEFVIANMQCPDCQASFTEHTWESCVQLRQHRKHKRTMFMLEQLLIKNNICPDVMSIKVVSQGLDFYFKTQSQAKRLIDFVKSSLAVKINFGKKLISEDLSSNTHKHKYNTLLEIAPACKDDVILLSQKMANEINSHTNIMLCYRVSNTIHLIDPVSLKTAEISSERYFNDEPRIMISHDRLVEFTVLDVHIIGDDVQYNQQQAFSMKQYNKQNYYNQRLVHAEVTVARIADLGVNDIQYTVMTHLGGYLQPGDAVLGYDIAQHNLTDEAYNKLSGLPDVILVRKTYTNIKKRTERRQWVLKRLSKEESDRALKKHEIDREQREFEEFMMEVEEDPEVAAHVNVYAKYSTAAEQEEHKRRFGHLDNDDDDGAHELPNLMAQVVLNDERIVPVPMDQDEMDQEGYEQYGDDDEEGQQAPQQEHQIVSGRGLRNEQLGITQQTGGFESTEANYIPFSNQYKK